MIKAEKALYDSLMTLYASKDHSLGCPVRRGLKTCKCTVGKEIMKSVRFVKPKDYPTNVRQDLTGTYRVD